MAEVAQRAGVSQATASKVLNGRDDVAPETRDRVLGVLAETGYRPTTARAARPRDRAIVTVLDFLESRYAGTVLQGILVAATSTMTELLLRLPPEASVGASRDAARRWIAEQQEAGAVGLIELATAVPDPVLDAAVDLGVPVVTIDPLDTTDARVVSIGSTNWAGGRAATEHVIGLGHRRIAWIGGPARSTPSAERFHGYQAALSAADLPGDPALVRHDTFSYEAGLRHGRELLTTAAPPTAVIAGNDEIAIGVLAAARELRLDVPGDVSVTGFDDTPQTEWTTPALTSVHQPLAGMGRMAVETVLAMADGTQPVSRHVQLATTLTVRDSTGPVAAT